MTGQVDTPVTVDHTDSDGASFSVTTNTATEKEVREALEVDTEKGVEEKPDLSKSASELGKKGGEAAAKARAAAKKAGANGAEDDDEEPPEEEPEDRAAKPLGKPRHDPRARVAQVTREHAETKRRLEAERQEKEELRRRLADVEARTRTPEERSQIEARQRDRDRERRPPDPPGKPQPEDYADYDEYLEARLEWRDQVREARQAVERDHQERAGRLHDVKMGYANSVRETLKTDAEFMDRVSSDVSDLTPTFELEDGRRPSARNWIADEIVLSPKDAPALMLYLTEHPDDFQRIAALQTHREVSREMARLPLEAALSGTSSKGRSVSKAYPPIRPVSGEPHVASGEGSDEESFDDFMRREDAREAKRRASRR